MIFFNFHCLILIYGAAFIVGGIGGFGVTGGAHRYFTHRSFKAKLPLQLILILCYTVSGQVCYTLVNIEIFKCLVVVYASLHICLL